MADKFFLDTDESSHWYLVPWDKKKEWDAWRELDPDTEAAWDAPEWAQAVNGPHDVVFENPQTGYVR